MSAKKFFALASTSADSETRMPTCRPALALAHGDEASKPGVAPPAFLFDTVVFEPINSWRAGRLMMSRTVVRLRLPRRAGAHRGRPHIEE
jgi:hypothetical protein